MKKLSVFSFSFFLCLLLSATITTAQVRTPAPSVACKTEQTVGLTKITLEYSRPSMKGRTIFGGLLPYGSVWRVGANAATKISFDNDVVVEGNDLKKGSYAILATPGEKTWDISLYPYESSNFGSYVDQTEGKVSFTVTANELPVTVESMMINVGNITNNTANIYILWENTMVPIEVDVKADEMVKASIKQMMAGPSANDLYSAGTYLFNADIDKEKGLKMVNKAFEKRSPRYWELRQKSLMLADLGKKEEAVKFAKKSLAMAKEAGNDDYIRMNTASIKEWTEM